jgi:hypothetical protein
MTTNDKNYMKIYMRRRRAVEKNYGQRNFIRIERKYPSAVVTIIKDYLKTNCKKCVKSCSKEVGQCTKSYDLVLQCMLVKEVLSESK